jgi:hypothetical protein
MGDTKEHEDNLFSLLLWVVISFGNRFFTHTIFVILRSVTSKRFLQLASRTEGPRGSEPDKGRNHTQAASLSSFVFLCVLCG